MIRRHRDHARPIEQMGSQSLPTSQRPAHRGTEQAHVALCAVPGCLIVAALSVFPIRKQERFCRRHR